MKMGENKKFKFDVVIGNPPYQEETIETNTDRDSMTRNVRVKSIFQLFQESADQISSEYTDLIYPGGRWIHQAGKGLQNFGYKQINDIHLDKLIFYPNANDVFPGIQVADGISIVIKDVRKTIPGFEYIYVKNGIQESVEVDNPGEQLLILNPKDLAICNKIDKFVVKNKLKYLHDSVLSQKFFQIESSFVTDHPDLVTPCTKDTQITDPNQVKLFTNDKAGKTGRARWFLTTKDAIPVNREFISQWQVVVSSANAGGQKRDNQLEIIDNHSAFGRSRVALKSFKRKEEASNFYKYMKTYLVRFSFLMTDESLTALGKRVPDLLDYSAENKFVDFNDDLNQQLYQLIGLNSEEIQYLENRVKNIRNKKEMA
ncbi:Eco57I restriction-modification methylase domain-containing protein [uncultured Acidaminococcus sp.]|uniref:Eco57I restriction-modification methylase domain-containing protein n=1 Tax=uncultured Acidaminococcus sp. TaxID=352152 RepID=UPI0029430E31|nr:Eco57I restriction-modification methylase domain-containing protein [uncultured Acidaminococcus sp.]